MNFLFYIIQYKVEFLRTKNVGITFRDKRDRYARQILAVSPSIVISLLTFLGHCLYLLFFNWSISLYLYLYSGRKTQEMTKK